MNILASKSARLVSSATGFLSKRSMKAARVICRYGQNRVYTAIAIVAIAGASVLVPTEHKSATVSPEPATTVYWAGAQIVEMAVFPLTFATQSTSIQSEQLALEEPTTLITIEPNAIADHPVVASATSSESSQAGTDLLDAAGDTPGNAIARASTQMQPSARGATRPAETQQVQAPIALPRNLPSNRVKFMTEAIPQAQASSAKTGVPASVTLAQAILESNWGESRLATVGKNFFGIKATNGPGTAGVINMSTWEVLSGRNVTIVAGFRAYKTMEDSFDDHGTFLRQNKRYARAFEVLDNPKEFARRIHAAGYATDPAYSTKLIRIMDTYNLYQYDPK